MKKNSNCDWCAQWHPYFKLLIMFKCILLLILVSVADAFSKGYSQTRINLSIDNASIKKVLKEIEKTTEYRFLYSDDLLTGSKIRSVEVKDASLEEAMKSILANTGLSYSKNADHLVIITTSGQVVQSITVTGTVLDSQGNPLPGVAVKVKGMTNGATTDVNGKFNVVVPDSKAVLVFSFIGFSTEEKVVGENTVMKVVLKEAATDLNEVVIIGYGTVKKSDLTGSVVSVRESQITSTPVTNVMESLQGKVAGLDLTRGSGETGAAMNFTIRGNRSLRANNSPLILVDGVQYGSYIDINPNDIASVEVLKDASSTAIYGSRGANGVILVTTKSGKSGKTKVEFNNYYGVNRLTEFPAITNTEQLVAMWREEYRSVGQWNSPADDATIFPGELMGLIGQGVNTSWVDLMVHNGSVQNYHAAVSGGTEKTTFRVSTEHFNEKGFLANDQLKRYVQHLNLDHRINKKIKVGSILNFNTSNQDRRNTSFWNLIKNSPLSLPFNEDGSAKKYPFPNGSLSLNPLLDENPEDYTNNTKSNHLFLQGFGDWAILPKLSLRTSVGYDMGNSMQGIFESANSTQMGVNSGLSRAAQYHNRFNNLTWENVLTYNAELKDHAVTAMAGTSLIKNRATWLRAEGKNQPFTSSLFYNLGNNASQLLTQSSLTESALTSYFGRINYKFKDRYLLTTTFRADGASVLAEGHKWAYFPSVAAAWRAIDEPILAGVKSVLSDLKFRLSYGESGSSAVTEYQTQGGLARVAYSFDETAAFGFWPKLLANPSLGWERTATLNFGVDVGLFNNRLNATVDIYKTKTSDLLLDRQLPSLIGFEKVIDNVGKTETHGLDLIISSKNISGKNFKWETDFNFSTFNEKIIELSTPANDIGNGWFIGSPTRVIYDYEKTGIWQLGEEAEAIKYAATNKPGMIKVKDQDGDGKITADKDRKIIGQLTPDWTAGFNNNFSYKNLTLSILAFARWGQTIRSEYHGYYYPGGTAAVVDYWTPENPTNAYPRPTRSQDPYLSTLNYRDGSFFKIKDIRLAYTFKSNVLRNSPVNFTLYGTAKNYFTFSKIKDYDPERGGSVEFPLTKQMVFGLNIGL